MYPKSLSFIKISILGCRYHYSIWWIRGRRALHTRYEKIRKIRQVVIEKNLNIDIEVDGGIKANWTISQCAAAGANCFIAGSGMFAYPTLKEGCDELRSVALDAQNGKIIAEP